MKFLTIEENATALANLKMSAEYIKRIEKVAVHGDKFHADDVAVVALIYIVKDELGLINVGPTTWASQNVVRIKRQDIPEFAKSEHPNVFVADMLGGLYDHHDMLVVRYPKDNHWNIEHDEIMSQIEKRWACPYASAGKIWHAIGHLFGLKDRFVELVDKNLFLGLDLNDNFGGMILENGVKIVNPISSLVSSLNYSDITNEAEQLKQFTTAVYFMWNLITASIYEAKKAQETYENYGIEELENNADGGVIVVDKYVPANLFDINKVAYVVSPNNKPGWYQVSSVNSDLKPIKGRDELSEEVQKELDDWDRLHNDKVFFHKSRFLAVLPTIELAESVAKESVAV